MARLGAGSTGTPPSPSDTAQQFISSIMGAQAGTGGAVYGPPSTGGTTAAQRAGMAPVYLGRTPFGPTVLNEKAGSGRHLGGETHVTDNQSAKDEVYSDQFDVEGWRNWLIHIGAIDPDQADYPTLRKWWQDAVDEATTWYSHGKTNVDPYKAAAILAGQDPNSAGGPGSTAGSRARTADQTLRSRNITKSINLTDPESARAIVTAAMSKYLGRDPNSSEVSAYIQTLNDSERANPQVTTTDTTTKYDTNGNPVGTTNTVSSTGGVSTEQANGMAQKQAQSLPDYGAYQAASFYAPLLFQALAAPA